MNRKRRIRRNPAAPEPRHKRGRANPKYRSKEERAMFQLGNRATLKETAHE